MKDVSHFCGWVVQQDLLNFGGKYVLFAAQIRVFVCRKADFGLYVNSSEIANQRWSPVNSTGGLTMHYRRSILSEIRFGLRSFTQIESEIH
jgi:hypothetical protein